MRLVKGALAIAPSLLEKWRKVGRPLPGSAAPHGYGWHELLTNGHAGSHASSAVIKLIVHPCFPIPAAKRRRWIKDAALGILIPFIETQPNSSPEHEERLLEAQQCTVKIANFLSVCAALGASKDFQEFYKKKLRPLAHRNADRLVTALSVGGIGHWIDHLQRELQRPFPTAAAHDALYRLSCVDADAKKLASTVVRNFAVDTLKTFESLFTKYGGQPPAPELWQLLPALRTVSVMQDAWWKGAGLSLPTRDTFERIFNAYLRHELFGFALNHTDDFQKYRADGTASGTDYVAFNSTACLVRAILCAIETGKIHPSYAEWVAPHLCTWAEQLCHDQLPQPARFSYIHQTLSCLLAAVHLESSRKCIPKTIHMNIFPRVFPHHAFARKATQGFYVTPFEFPPEWNMTMSSDALFTEFQSACAGFRLADGRNVNLVRGDHTNMGVITENIWRHINESHFIIAICIGANPNVYYELGMADTLGKPALLVGRKMGRLIAARGKKESQLGLRKVTSNSIFPTSTMRN